MGIGETVSVLVTLIVFVIYHCALTELSCETVSDTVDDTVTDCVGLAVAITVGEDTRTPIADREGLVSPVGELFGEPEGVFWPEAVSEEVGKLREA